MIAGNCQPLEKMTLYQVIPEANPGFSWAKLKNVTRVTLNICSYQTCTHCCLAALRSAARCGIDPSPIRLCNSLIPRLRHRGGVCSVHISESSLAAPCSRALQCVCTAWPRSGPCSTAPTPTRRAPITAGCSTKVASPTPGLAQWVSP